VSGNGMVSLMGLDPATYEPHAVHQPGERNYTETNCYSDILIELIHARGAEPLAAAAFTVRMDFEGDQWTFFKPPEEDVEALFGIDIHEMQPYRTVPEHILEQLQAGRTMTVELDSWFLPDTADTSYRTEHVKTSVVAEAIDTEGERLHYFHNTSLHQLSGEDYRGVFRVGEEPGGEILPPYTELVRFDAGPQLEGEALREASRALLRDHLARRPETNPFTRWGDRLTADLPGLLEGDVENYHAYAFATVRMFGSAFEVAASHVDWLLGEDGAEASAALKEIVEGSKVLSMRLARRKPFDHESRVAALGEAWERAMGALDAAVS
jgi:hypothetical protein